MSPWHLASEGVTGPAAEGYNGGSLTQLTDLSSVDIVLTDDKTRWTRVPVIEIQNNPAFAEGGAIKTGKRRALSVDKNGLNQLNGGDIDECTFEGQQVITPEELAEMQDDEINGLKSSVWPTQDPSTIDDAELIGLSFGMGWFPGYAIDVDNGERLAMAFGENSGLPEENGRDMIWNPTSNLTSEFNESTFFAPQNARFGGMHYIYVFRNFRRQDVKNERMTHYDGANYLYHNINVRQGSGGWNSSARRFVFRSCQWVVFPLLSEFFALRSIEDGLIPTETTIRIRVGKPYQRFAPVSGLSEAYPYVGEEDDEDSEYFQNFPYFDYEAPGVFDDNVTDGAISQSINNWWPTYGFTTDGKEAITNVSSVLEAALEDSKVNVVPNPYYAFSEYESSALDNRVRIINLPNRCLIRIYNTSGTLVRTFDKDTPETTLDWDLRNEDNVPIAGGTYIFHIEVPGVSEQIVKWFGALRPIDLDNF